MAVTVQFNATNVAGWIKEGDLARLSAARLLGLSYVSPMLFDKSNKLGLPPLNTSPLVYAMLTDARRSFELMHAYAKWSLANPVVEFTLPGEAGKICKGTALDVAFAMTIRGNKAGRDYLRSLLIAGARDVEDKHWLPYLATRVERLNLLESKTPPKQSRLAQPA